MNYIQTNNRDGPGKENFDLEKWLRIYRPQTKVILTSGDPHAVEKPSVVAGAAAGSGALQADALDLSGDAANYAISLDVAVRRSGGVPAPGT
jgi:hypothetical protein